MKEIKIRIHLKSGKFFEVFFNTEKDNYDEAFYSIFDLVNKNLPNRTCVTFETLKRKMVSILLNDIIAIEQL